jgi:hypothetical protein
MKPVHRRIQILTAIVAVVTCLTINVAASQSFEQPDQFRIQEGDDPAWSSPDFDDSLWETVTRRAIDPQGRLLWVRARVALPDGFDRNASPISVYVSALAAYEVYWNGVLIGGSGAPGRSSDDEVPGRLDTSHYVPPTLFRQDNSLVLRMSSFHLRRELASPFQFLSIEETGAPGQRIFMGRVPMFVAAGALLVGAAYFAAMFISNRRDFAALQLSILALAVLAHLTVEAARFVSYVYPLQILRLEAILAAAVCSGLLLVLYATSQFARSWRNTLLATAIGLMVATAAFVPGFDGKTALVIVSALLIVVFAAIIGMRAGVPAAGETAVAAGAVIALFAFDPSSFVDRNYYMAATAFLLFLFAQQVRVLRRAEASRSAAQLRSARLELELLKRQIQPHFLMNSLTAATEWIESDPKMGVRMIEALAEELRWFGSMSDKLVVPIDDELSLCHRHLEVMSLRRDVSFSLTTEGQERGGHTPPGVFHTLIENALTHNQYARGAVFRLEIEPVTGDRIVYRLRSPLELSESGRGQGRGHEYIRARLDEAFRNDWSFSTGPSGSEWVDVIVMPARSAGTDGRR